MNEQKMALASRTSDRVVGNAQDAVLLYQPKDKPSLLTFGPNRVSEVEYFIHLHGSNGSEVEFSSEDAQPFVLLMDHCESNNRVRLAFYVGDSPVPVFEYDAGRGTQTLEGEVLIQAQSKDGAHYVTIYAGFDPADDGRTGGILWIDGTREMFTHFRKYRSMLTDEDLDHVYG